MIIQIYQNLSKKIQSVREIVKKAFSEDSPPRFGNFSEKMRNEIAQKVDEPINICEKAIKKCVPRKRRTRIGDRIIDHLYINLSLAYFLKGNWGKAYKSVSMVNINKKEIRESKSLRYKIEDYVNRININK